MITFLLLTFAIWRVGLFITSFVAERLLTFDPRFPYSEVLLIPSKLPSWIWSFANFDGVHYITIAKTAYSAQFTQVFFPLFPILVRFSSFIFNNSYIIGGLVIANISFIVALQLLTNLLKVDNKNTNARWTVLFIVTFPFSFFFGSMYTESIFLCFVLASFLAARKKNWIVAGIFAGLASAMRFIGIFLLPALLWEWLNSEFHSYRHPEVKSRRIPLRFFGRHIDLRMTLLQLLALLKSPVTYLAPLGLLSYMVYLQWKFNDFLYFWHAQPVFGAQRSGSKIIPPPQVLWRYGKILLTVPYTSYDFWVSLWELLAFLFVTLLLIVAHRRKIRVSYLIFSWLAVLVPVLTGTLSSIPRYILVVFPMYIVLGQIKNAKFKSMLLAVQVILLIIFTGLFTQGRWVS